MMEKLKLHPVCNNNGEVYAEIEPDNTELREVINQLIDVVNTLVEENNIHEKQIDKLQMKLEPEKCETPADPYAEQRKWIGKLCWFWDEDREDKTVDVLCYIEENDKFPYVQKKYPARYIHCEPVSEDLIYKGE